MTTPRDTAEVVAEPAEYLVGYFEAFRLPVRVEPLPAGRCLVECRVPAASPSAERLLEEALAREVAAERSHRRYADALDAALARCRGGLRGFLGTHRPSSGKWGPTSDFGCGLRIHFCSNVVEVWSQQPVEERAAAVERSAALCRRT